MKQLLGPWEKLGEQTVYKGYRNILRRTYRLPNGQVADFDVVQEPHVVCVLALTEAQEVVLVQQFRPGPEEMFLDLPGGGVHPGESPIDAAARELLEETGFAAAELTCIGTGYEGGYSTLFRTHFVARGCRKVAEPQLDEHEFLKVQLVTLEGFRTHLRTGKLVDVATGYLALDYLNLLS